MRVFRQCTPYSKNRILISNVLACHSHRIQTSYSKAVYSLYRLVLLCTGSNRQLSLNSHTNESIDFRDRVEVSEIADDGGKITIDFQPSKSFRSTFHASWLWSNDPARVLLPSGQRTCTPGQWSSNYGRPKIKDAKIIYYHISYSNSKKEQSENYNEPAIHSNTPLKVNVTVPGPTPKDCCHPLSVYGTDASWIAAYSYDISTENESILTKLRPYLEITWLTPQHATNENDVMTNVSTYDVEWLQRLRYDDPSGCSHRKKTEIQPVHAIRRSGPPLWYSMKESLRNDNEWRSSNKHNKDGLIHVSYHSIISHDGQVVKQGLIDLLDAVFHDGAAIVFDAPPSSHTNHDESVIEEKSSAEDFSVAKIAKAMSGGSLSHGHLYGNIFHVRAGERGSTNIAYTSAPLCPHQDLAYYESPPGMQLLHCASLGKGVVGGESTLVDAMAAAYRLRELRPRSFECLVRCPSTFVKQRSDACMTFRRPHIVLEKEGYCSGGSQTVFDRQIVAVYWSPPFEGPVRLPPDDIDRYYEAYADFERMLDDAVGHCSNGSDELSQYAKEHTWERRLAPGEVLVFNNRRMVHGRRGFTAAQGVSSEDSKRHLIGCYTNLDETLSQYRVLLRERDNDENNHFKPHIRNVGNGTSVSP